MMVPVTGRPDTNAFVDAATHQQPAALQAEVSSTEVLITGQQVLLSTAAALAVRRESIGGRLVAITRRIFATAPHPSRTRPRYCPKRYRFLEDALMAREMERL